MTPGSPWAGDRHGMVQLVTVRTDHRKSLLRTCFTWRSFWWFSLSMDLCSSSLPVDYLGIEQNQYSNALMKLQEAWSHSLGKWTISCISMGLLPPEFKDSSLSRIMMSYFTFDHLEDASISSCGIELPLMSAHGLKQSCTKSHLSTRQLRCKCILSRRKSVSLCKLSM